MAAGLHFLFPLEDLAFLILDDGFGDRVVQFKDIFILFTLSNGGTQVLDLLLGLTHTFMQALAPGQRTRNGGHVVVNGRVKEVSIFNIAAAFQEDGLHLFEILFVDIQQDNMFLLEFVLDDRTVEESLEGVEELEAAVDGVAVVEALGDDRGETTLELLDLGSELIEVIVEGLDFDVHDIIGQELELLLSVLELVVDLLEGVGQGLALRAAQDDVL